MNKKEAEQINRLCVYPVELHGIIRGNENGFYALDKKEVVRFCVHPDHRDTGVGTRLHNDLIKIARQHGYDYIIMVIHEEAEALTWFRELWGWEGVSIKRNYFGDRDGYLLQRKIIR